MLNIMNSQDSYRASSSRSACDWRRWRGRRGFTLAEILIALGILAIGMSMVAAIFPAAMVLNRQSANSTLGTIICENGLVMAEMVLTADVVSQSDELEIYADDNHDTYLARLRQFYPTDPKDPSVIRTGFVVMARKVTDGDKIPPGVFQLITVAYRKRKPSNTVELIKTGHKNSVNDRNVTGVSNLRIGSPLIDRTTGDFAYIDSINADKPGVPGGTAGTLDIKVNQTLNMPGDAGYYVLVEKDGGSIVDRRSPAIGVMSKMTGLNSNPAPPEGGGE